MNNTQINRGNYEVFFLDFWENNLGVEGRKALSQFLESNPDLQDEFLDFREALTVKLAHAEPIKYHDKQNLKHAVITPTENINQDNFEDYIIAKIENDLDAGQVAELDRFSALNPHLLPEFEGYAKTILVPDWEAVFENKQELKHAAKSPVIIRFVALGSAIAAMLLLAFLLVNPFVKPDTLDGMTAINGQRQFPAKPLPKLMPEKYDVPAVFHPERQEVKMKAADPQESLAEANVAEPVQSKNPQITIPSHDEFSRVSADISPISRDIEHPGLAVIPLHKMDIEPRTEMDGVFENLMLREEMLAHNDPKKPGAIQRVFNNLGNAVFGGGDAEQQSLLGQIAESGRERINEIRDEGPKLETVESEQAKMTYFAINENIRIRISKSSKPEGQPNSHQK